MTTIVATGSGLPRAEIPWPALATAYHTTRPDGAGFVWEWSVAVDQRGPLKRTFKVRIDSAGRCGSDPAYATASVWLHVASRWYNGIEDRRDARINIADPADLPAILAALPQLSLTMLPAAARASGGEE